ncbi:DUF3413 domain-containing protein [Salmonella enterica subsp. enterica]|nr:DUF3413 domain-containing protein [Salmonella enterica subsp. enterica]
MSQRLMRFYQPLILATAGMTFVAYRQRSLYPFSPASNSLSGELVINPDQNENGARLAAYALISVPVILLIEMLFGDMELGKSCAVRTRRRHFARPLSAAFFVSFIVPHLIYIQADANFYRPITMQRGQNFHALIRCICATL